jgi:ribosomal protein L24
MKRVPSDSMLQYVSAAKRTHTPQTWTTISRGASKWKRYEGDIALVALHRSRLVAIIIPRIALSKIEGKKRRASARPCKLVDLHISLGNNTEAIGNGFYTYKDHVFTPDGFIITDIEDVPTKPPHEHPVPTYEVLRTYRESEWLTPSMYQQTEREIAQRQIKIHDRVQITAGVYLGLTGNIIDISSTEASVFIESQDHTPQLPLNELRMHFVVGDEVEVVSGEFRGTTGWVVNISDEEMTIYNMRQNSQVRYIFTMQETIHI